MALPIDLLLLRHGQSERNLAKQLSEKGDHGTYTTEFWQRHTSNSRLTELGCTQAKRAGNWILKEFGRFDRYYTSEYLRAMETAALLGLPDATWFTDFYLTERNWGDLENCPENEQREKFGEALTRRDDEPFFWAPPNGESFSDLCLRVDRVLDTLHRECADKRVLIVCHGEVMWAFRVRIERMSQVRFRELHLSKDPGDRIYNCQIIHYTRRDPVSSRLERYANWMQMVRPTDDPVTNMGWQRITRPPLSNDNLFEIVSHVLPIA